MKKLYVLGGGTISHVRNHLGLCAPAFGSTARRLVELCKVKFKDMSVHPMLTKMADSTSHIITNDDVKNQVEGLKGDMDTKIIFFNVAMCDWKGEMGVNMDKDEKRIPSGKYADRLKTSEGYKMMLLTPAEKVIRTVKEDREDIFLVGFKTTCGATEQEQYESGYALLERGDVDLVLANDTRTRNNIVIHKKGNHRTKDREEALSVLVETAYNMVYS